MNSKVRLLTRYLAALLAVLVSYLVRQALLVYLGESLPSYFTFFPAIMIIGLVAGLGPGIVATIAATLIIGYFILPPYGFGIAKRGDLIVLAFFSMLGLCMSVIANLYLQMRNRLNKTVAERTESLHSVNEELASINEELQSQTAELIEVNEELKIAQESLQLSEERFRTMFERHNAVMLVVKPETGAIIDANTAASRFYGYSHDQLVGMEIQELNCLPPEDVAAERQRAAGEECGNFLFPHRLANGDQRWVEVYSSPFTDSGSKLLFSIIHDVTARKLSENEQIAAQQRLASDYRALTHLQTISALFMRKGNMAQLLDTILDAAIAIAGADKGTLQLFDTQLGSLRIMAQHGFEQPFLDFWNAVREGEGACGTALQTARPVIIEDITHSSVFAEQPALEVLLVAGVRAVQSIPIQSREGRILGILSTHFVEPYQSDEQTIQMLDLLATLSADIIERSRNEEELRDSRLAAINLMDDAIMARTTLEEANARLNLLADTAGELLVTDSPQDAVESLCTKALSILDCHAFFNFLVDPDSGRLRLNACAGIPAEEKKNIEWLDFGVAVCGCVARDGSRIVAENIQLSGDERTELVKSYGIKAYACHPLMTAEEVIGTISFGSRSRSSFSDDDLAVMKAVADLVAIAMERKRIEESLTRAKREWERTFDSVPDLIAILDEQHRIIRVNRSMAQHLGREPKDCIGVYCHEAIHGTTCPPEFCPHSRSLCDNKTHSVEVYEESLGGDFIVSTTPLHQDDGKLIGTVHVARDISDRKRAEDALKAAHGQLEEKVKERTAQLADTIEVLQEEVQEREKAQESLKNEMVERLRVMESLREQEKLLVLQSRQAAMGEMIGNIAHQWRQPLNILGLLMQQMEIFYSTGKFDADFLGASVSKGMGIIQHMSQTIDDFRNFFRPENEPKMFSILESINSTIALINDSFVSYTIKIDVNNQHELEVVGYPNEFSQALLNILLNAKDVLLEREIPGPRISISVEKANGKGIIIINDNAGGMEESIIDKIFDPYFTTKGPQQGTGLGLYMAKMIIEKNMGGHLSAINGAVGAEFRIEFNNVPK